MMSKSTAGKEVFKIALPLIILAAGIAGALLLVGMQGKPASATVERAEATVATVTVAAHNEGIDIQVDGLVTPFREVALSAEVAGRIKTVTEKCLAGKHVSAGDLLLEIDPTDYELEVQRLTHELNQAIAAIEEGDVELGSTRQLLPLVKEEFDLQQKQLDRLVKLGSGVSTETAIDQARRGKLVAENALVKLDQQVNMLEKKQARLGFARDLVNSQLNKAKIDLARCRVTAPVDGIVVSETVEQDSFVAKGASLLTVEDTSAIDVKCNLMMEHLWWLWQQQAGAATGGNVPGGNPTGGTFQPPAADTWPRDYQLPKVDVTLLWELGGRHYAWKGRLDRYDGIGVNEKTRTVPCRVVVEQPRSVQLARDGDPRKLVPVEGGPPALVRGMFVSVRIHCQPRTPLLRLPERAIRPGKVVWLLRDGKLAFEKVTLAAITRDEAIIDADNSNIRAGELAVVSPLAYAHDGMQVKRQETPTTPAAQRSPKSPQSPAESSTNRGRPSST
jgi:multidrug efflux pump subunit AcrA (membrane-fusion protein)